ncbi:transglutaminase-like domain-containing protein [Halarcobacter ebronensis]|uniref:Transglutaminase n=1 Tax=Halarcobacter ebronensis TaxID=1462615 RepID=A0A4Q1AK68_9BACT|nr:transglutaminase-like domain-containing protein [Halarcobacter ebronensis]RXK04644.1 transglutaminase [Halarcobacter ebronensis]
MKRRTFLKSSALLSTTAMVSPSFVFAQTQTNPFGIKDGFRKFTITNTYKIEPSKEKTQLWIPVPLTSNYQELVDIKYDGNYEKAELVNNSYDSKVLYVLWSDGNKQKELTVTFEVITNQKTVDLSKAKSDQNYTAEVKTYLEPTAHIPVNDKIKTLANSITKNAKTPLDKAQAIYDWTVTTMYRDNSVVGCGLGDAGKALEEKLFGGKCTDISSVFVCLLRNSNIPAREVFGIRAGKSKISGACGKADEKGFANITGGQHCRAEFYISGLGWVKADPADVTKVRLAENLKNEDKKIQDTKKYMFGSWEMNWVAFNHARDFVLNPKPEQYPLNMLGYPYAEEGEDALNYYDPKSFSYSYTSQERV